MADSTQTSTRTWLYRPAAEFLLIVAGVLVALFIENWWASEQERDLEAEYIEALLEEAKTHIGAINAVARVSAYKRASLEEAANLLNQPFLPDKASDLIQGLLQGSGIPVVAELSEAVFSDLQSSGRLNLIRDDELRRAVLRYYAALPAMLQRAQRWADAADAELHAFISTRIPAGLIAQSGGRLEFVWGDVDQDQISEIGADIHAMGEVRGYVNAQARQLEAERDTLENMSQRLERYMALFNEIEQ